MSGLDGKSEACGRTTWKDVWNEMKLIYTVFQGHIHSVIVFVTDWTQMNSHLIAQSEHDFPCQGSLDTKNQYFDAKKTKKGYNDLPCKPSFLHQLDFLK